MSGRDEKPALPLAGRVNASKTWVNPLEAAGAGPSTSPLPPKPIVKRPRSPASPAREPDRYRPNDPPSGSNGRAHALDPPRQARGRSPDSDSRYAPKRRYEEMDVRGPRFREPQDFSAWDSGRQDRYIPGSEAGLRDNGYGNSSRGPPRSDERRYDDPHRYDSRPDRYDNYSHSGHGRSSDRWDEGHRSPRRRQSSHYEPGEWEGYDHERERLYNPRSSPNRNRNPRRRSRSRTRSRSPRRRTADPEEGEIAEDEVRQDQSVLGGSQEPPRTGTATAPSSQQASETGSSSYQPIKIKNRPTKRSSEVSIPAPVDEPMNGVSRSDTHTSAILPPPPPPPVDDRPATPPSLPTPPPPPERPPTPPPEPSRETPKSIPTGRSSSQPPRPPHNRALDITKSQAKYDEHGDRVDGKTSAPHAPNRNLLNPTTRPSTPSARGDATPHSDTPIKTFRLPTAAEEMDNLQKTFFGTTTLAAYDLGDKLGEGTFGVVTKGVELATKRAIALKKLITHNPRDGVSVTTVREIKILKMLKHPNIVEIIDMVVQRKNPLDRTHRGDVFMVFPYMDHDLCGLLTNSDFKMSHSIAKLFMRQIFEGMDYIHVNNAIHRDIKTANILVDREGGIKIADFGLARTWTYNKLMPKHMANEYTNMVVTRWYRAPELLLGDRHYGPAVDMWSLGCVLGELYNRSPILQGETDRDQLFKIFGRVDRPSDTSFPGWDKLPGFPESIGYAWDKVPEDRTILSLARAWGMDRAGADLMLQLLRLDPVRRLSACDALNHSWFWCSPKPAVKAKDLIKVESSHEMTQRIKNASPPMINRPKPQRPPQRPPPAWNNGPPRHTQMHMGMNGIPPHAHGQNPYAPPNTGPSHMNPYNQRPPQQPFNAPPVAVYQNGHGHGPAPGYRPPGMNGPGVSSGNPYAGGGGGAGGGMNLPPKPGGYHSRPPPLGQAFGPGAGMGHQPRPPSRSHAPPLPTAFALQPSRRPPSSSMDAQYDAGASNRQEGLPYS